MHTADSVLPEYQNPEVDVRQFRTGLAVELEHGRRDVR
jgi:hypothetical protein